MNDRIDGPFSGLILKVVVLMLLFAAAEVVGFVAAKRLATKRHSRQALGQFIAVILFAALAYVLVLSKYAIV